MTTASASRRALIVIDVQNEYVTGGLRIEHPPVEQSLARIAQAIDAAHTAVDSHAAAQPRTAVAVH